MLPSGVWAPSLLCFFIGKRGTVKPELRTQGQHGAPSSGPGCHEDPACASFPVVIDRGARGLLFSIKWEKVTMVRKWGLLGKAFQTWGLGDGEFWW